MAPPRLAVPLVELREGHLAELLPMWRESFERGVGIVDPHPLEEQLAFFRREVMPRHGVRVALEGERIVGFVSANAESVAQLYVRVGCQGRGIGARMLEWAKAQSGGSLWLHTLACNHGARAFYERQGFRIHGRGYVPFWSMGDILYKWRRA